MIKNILKKENYNQNLNSRYTKGKLYFTVFFTALMIAIIGLAILLFQIISQGTEMLSWTFVSSYPSRFPEKAGILSALVGSIWLMGLTGIFAVPLGIGTAVYLEEYAPKNKFTQFLEINISNLAGVPSIVYGLLGLAVFVGALNMGRTLIAGALTMALLVMPIVILASREAIKQVPYSHREAAYALGATRWEVVRSVVLPSAIPGIMTGAILSMSRAVGEAAPVLAVSALVYLTFVPTDPFDRFTVMPIQIYNWVSRPQDGFRELAASGIILLLVLLLSMNSIAIYIRSKYQNKSEE
ncbi:MAG: phosphate ABC transporter permease PstA [SAR202 cluster bacterium]|nr:phosphate ABC transporter, permease protein PstA [Chloroflexota bacterium]MCH2522380.1 phosphate ABC transporter permease PstA [Dehalococcoidia bacterium]MQG24814.1 phosphate ABC transporter permease PstA [SAR202 cluster bacterium]MQG50995.1 phosphate ABC transporter permease PstA [SAR202 cluster bacterium]MQG85485.1 phosphate ABC transporter permease PstA [SAR202 cluster bacterium]|tara:strand:- start:521 stop:1411 length:891 start_codon:yes stop_codon:yes gene_type:complete